MIRGLDTRVAVRDGKAGSKCPSSLSVELDTNLSAKRFALSVYPCIFVLLSHSPIFLPTSCIGDFFAFLEAYISKLSEGILLQIGKQSE